MKKGEVAKEKGNNRIKALSVKVGAFYKANSFLYRSLSIALLISKTTTRLQ